MSFNFPDNMNEPTHSTQFSFDEQSICPNFISLPSLSTHASNKSVHSNSSNDGVVDAISCMENGCLMIILKLEMDDKEELSTHNNNNNTIEWNLYHLDINHEYIELDQHNRINICDIDKINKLDMDTISQISSTLNISGLQENGLQAVTLRLMMKNCDNYFLIFDEYQTCFIWNRALKSMKNMISINHPISTIAFCVSSIDRINNDEMHQKMKINNDDHGIKWIKQIKNKLHKVQKHIHQCDQFAQSFCILDSSEHLSLLLQTKSLKEMYFDAKKLASIPYRQLSKNEIASLREVWLSILADLTVAILKEHQLKNDINTSKKNIMSKQLQTK